MKMGPERAAELLAAGCNDMGGSIMNESITKAAGALCNLLDVCRSLALMFSSLSHEEHLCNMPPLATSSSARTYTGAEHGQELPPERMEALIHAAGRKPRQRTTLYGEPPLSQVAASYNARPLVAV